MPQDMAPASIQRVPRFFDLTSFLHGRTRAWGVFEDRFGNVRRRLTVDMLGRWEGGEFVLEEQFVYDGVSSEQRTWRVVPEANGRFRAACSDCVGEAIGQCAQDSVRMSYRFRLKLDARDLVVTLDDRLYQIGPDHAINRARMSKWGVKLGELSLLFERIPDRK
ncbi:MAG TPA: DUF3833 family protein [Hyphomicrobiaceae bacterium]|nr:DUF3833 family protein [Hyphomicrobiaceae bacterium]